jgi:hypothetical protein
MNNTSDSAAAAAAPAKIAPHETPEREVSTASACAWKSGLTEFACMISPLNFFCWYFCAQAPPVGRSRPDS